MSFFGIGESFRPEKVLENRKSDKHKRHYMIGQREFNAYLRIPGKAHSKGGPCQSEANAVTMRGKPLTPVGDEIKVAGKAPDIEMIDNSLSPVKLSYYTGKIVVIVLVPSLDTPVCDLENEPNYKATLKALNQCLTG
jgi:hypothetical protein